MNKKISSGEVLSIATVLVAIMFFCFINAKILSVAKNASLIAFPIATVLGIIPILMIMFISKKIDTDFLTFMKEKFKIFSYPIIIILTIMAIYLIMVNSWVVVDFIISQFLTRESYYFIAIIFSLLASLCVIRGIEVMSRSIFVLFIITITIILIFLGTIVPFVDIENYKPLIDTSKINIIKGIVICLLNTTAPLIYILYLKGSCTDKKSFPKKILLGYIFIMIVMFLFLFFAIGTYGINYAELLTYPTHSLFKKTQVFGFIERIENISTVIFITAFFAEFSYLIYIIKDNLNNMFKIKEKKITFLLIILISLIVPIITIYLFKTYNMTFMLKYTHYFLIINFIIIFIIFIRCLFIRKN